MHAYVFLSHFLIFESGPQLGWLASELQRSTCLCFLNTRIIDARIQIFMLAQQARYHLGGLLGPILSLSIGFFSQGLPPTLELPYIISFSTLQTPSAYCYTRDSQLSGSPLSPRKRTRPPGPSKHASSFAVLFRAT